MNFLISKKSGKPIQVMDGLAVETDTPTLFPQGHTVERIGEYVHGVSNDTHKLQVADYMYYKQGMIDSTNKRIAELDADDFEGLAWHTKFLEFLDCLK